MMGGQSPPGGPSANHRVSAHPLLDQHTHLQYYPIMTSPSSSRFSPTLLNLSAYFIIPAVGLPMLWGLYQEGDPNFWIASGLLATFTLVLFLRERVFCRSMLGCYVYVATQTMLVTAMIWLPPHQLIAVVLFFVLSAEVSMIFPPRPLALWIALFSGITLVAYATLATVAGLTAVPIYVAGYIFFAIFAQQTARAEAARAESQDLLEKLQEAHRQLQAYSAQAEDLAVSQERNRLAREMHDTLGHRLTVAAVQLQAIERLIPNDPSRAVQMAGTAREQVKEALIDLRRTVATLRAPLEADLALEPALRRLTDSFQQATGIQVHLTLPEGSSDLPVSHRQAFYRSAQEGLTNIQKHAQASEAWLQLTRTDNSMQLIIRDNGGGLDGRNGHVSTGFGLRGLRERAVHLGGDFAIEAARQGGVQFVLTLPIDSAPTQASSEGEDD